MLAPETTVDLASALMSDPTPAIALQAALLVAQAKRAPRRASIVYQLFLSELIDATAQGRGEELLFATAPTLEQRVIDCLGRLERTKRAQAVRALATIGGQAAIDALAPLGTGGSRSAHRRDRQAEVRLVGGAIAMIHARMSPSEAPPSSPSQQHT